MALLSGVICSGTLLYQHLVKSKALRYIVRKMSVVAPYLVIDAPIPPQASLTFVHSFDT